jgi:hypothetical protein
VCFLADDYRLAGTTEGLKKSKLVMQCMVITCGATDESTERSELTFDFGSKTGVYGTNKVSD